MSVRWDTSTFFESSGNAAAEFSEQLRDGIVDFACGLWSSFPGFITNGKNIGSSFARGYMNSVCQNRVALPPPPVMFFGGQCPVEYRIRFQRGEYSVQDGSFQWATTGDLTFQGGTGVKSILVCRDVMPEQCFFPETDILPIGQAALYKVSITRNDDSQLDLSISGQQPAMRLITFANGSYFERTDGQPDDCGNPSVPYPSPPPTSNDLRTTILINNVDGLVNNYEIVYNQLSVTNNFPMGFKLNGVNVTLDFSGLTIHGDTSYTSFNFGNSVETPGHDGGDDGVGGEYTVELPDQDWTTIPDLTNPTQVSELIATVLCTDGVIEIIEETVKLLPGVSAPIKALLSMVANVVQEICDLDDTTATVGLPEYYSLLPGAGRAAIVYLFKEVMGDNWGSSTYSTTVSVPSAAAIAEIETVVVPDKTLGTWVMSLTMIDGSRLRVSGDTQASALSNFGFYLSRVDPSIVPSNVADIRTLTEYPRLEVKTVKCRQIEYYPDGAGANKNPSIRRVINLQ